MSTHNYITSKNEGTSHRSTDVWDLMERNALAAKEEKKTTYLIVASAVSFLALIVLIISL